MVDIFYYNVESSGTGGIKFRFWSSANLEVTKDISRKTTLTNGFPISVEILIFGALSHIYIYIYIIHVTS